MSLPQAPLYSSAPIYPSNKKKTHIYFGDEDTESQAVIQPIQRNGSNITNLAKAKMNGNGITNKNHSSPAAATVPPQLGALLSLRSAVFSKKEQVTNSQVKPVYNNVPPPSSTPPRKLTLATLDSNNEPSPATKVDFTKYPVFSGPPRVGDVIAFKVNSI